MKTFLNNTVVLINSEEELQEILQILHEDGRKWPAGESLLDKCPFNIEYPYGNLCIDVGAGSDIMYCDLVWYKNLKATIIFLKKFKKLTGIMLKEEKEKKCLLAQERKERKERKAREKFKKDQEEFKNSDLYELIG